MKFRHLVLFFILMGININFVNAEESVVCDKIKLKELAKNVQVDYEYLGFVTDDDSGISNEKYKVTISNLDSNLGVRVEDIMYNDPEGNTVSFETSIGDYTLYIEGFECDNGYVRKIDINLPAHNQYADEEICKKLKKYNLEVCDEWYQGIVDSEDFYNKVSPYLNNNDNNLISFIKMNYIYFVIGGVFSIVLIISLIIIKRKRSVLR